MADINATVKQLRERTEYFNTYSLTTAEFIGLSSEIPTLAKNNKKGSDYRYESTAGLSGVVQSSVTEKLEADRMKWTVQYKTNLSSGGSSTDPYTSRTWSMNMSQMEYPIERFLLSSDAFLLQKWRNTDDDHKSRYQYFEAMSQGAGPQYGDLTGRALSAANKVMKGLEGVMRFYPQATRTSIYSTKHEFATRKNKLNHIDTEPGDEFGNTFGGLSVQWLKSGFDWTENSDTTWTLTESWQAAEKWDPDLYGPNAWKFDGQ